MFFSLPCLFAKGFAIYARLVCTMKKMKNSLLGMLGQGPFCQPRPALSRKEEVEGLVDIRLRRLVWKSLFSLDHL